MEESNVLQQMAKYNFSNPINITILEDEDDNQKTTRKPQTKIKINIKDNNSKQKDKAIKRLKSIKNQFNDTSQNNLTMEFTAIDVAGNTPNIHQASDPIARHLHRSLDQQELLIFLRDNLNIVAKHLIVIMQAFYNYYCNGKTLNNFNRFQNIKLDLFVLSYNSVVSIILPQEKNADFINTFIDMTVADANFFYKLNYSRQHIASLFYEMLAWTKQRICTFKYNLTKYKKHSYVAPISPKKSCPITTTNLVNNSKENENHKNKLCIFSSGEPGREINIHVTVETLVSMKDATPENIKATPEKYINMNDNQHTSNTTQIWSHNNVLQTESNSQNRSNYQKPILPVPPRPHYSQTTGFHTNQSRENIAQSSTQCGIFNNPWLCTPLEQLSPPMTRESMKRLTHNVWNSWTQPVPPK